MARAHPFGRLLTQMRARIPGLTQARLAELAGYDSAVIARMAQGRQDLIGPQARDRVLHVIRALNETGALHSLDDANALLVAANLSPLIEARYLEAGIIQRVSMHGTIRRAFATGGKTVTAFDGVQKQLEEYARAWDKAGDDAERAVALAAAGEVALKNSRTRLGMRLLAHAALHEDAVMKSDGVLIADYARQLAVARMLCERTEYSNAWASGQLLTRPEVRAWLAVLPALVSQHMGDI